MINISTRPTHSLYQGHKYQMNTPNEQNKRYV